MIWGLLIAASIGFAVGVAVMAWLQISRESEHLE